MNINKRLTLIIIGHKNFEKYVPFFIELLNDFKWMTLFLFDNKIPIEIKKLLDLNGFNYHINETNIGKLQSLINFSSNINSEYVKIIDYDDSFSVDDFLKFYFEFIKINKKGLLVHRSAKLYRDDIFYGIQSTEKMIIKDQLISSKGTNWSISPNSANIYPVDIFSDISKVNISFQKYHNDNLLTIFTMMKYKDINYIDIPFYIQFHAFGQTSNYSRERLEDIIILWENLIKLEKSPIISNVLQRSLNDIWVKTNSYKNSINWIQKYIVNNSLIDNLWLTHFYNKINSLNRKLSPTQNSEPNIKKINFVLFFDSNFIEPFEKLYKSITKKYFGESYSINVGTDEQGVKYLKNKYPDIIVKNSTKIIQKHFKNHEMPSKRITNFTLGKLLIFNIFKDLDDCVYLDVDTFINKKIPDWLFILKNNFAISNQSSNREIKDRVKSYWSTVINDESILSGIIKKIDEDKYFNAGVLFINNKFDYVKLCEKIKNNLFYKGDDQNLLNYFNNDEILVLRDENYNFQVKNYDLSKFDYNNVFIFHFSGRMKPWNKSGELTFSKLLREICY